MPSRLKPIAALACAACLSLIAGAATADASMLLPVLGSATMHAGKHARTTSGHHGKKKKKKTSNRGPIGPQGLPGAKGLPGPQGPSGPQGPAGPGASKFSFSEAPSAGDPNHPVIPVGPFQLGIACQPGKEPGDVKLLLTAVFPAALTATLSATAWDGKAISSRVQDLSVPATGPVTAELIAENKSARAESVTYMLNAGGSLTSLVVWVGVVGGSNSEVAPHCYLSAIEL